MSRVRTRIRTLLAAGAATAVAALVATAVATGTPAALAGPPARGGGPVAQVRAATTAYRDVDRAVGAGYVQFFGCVHEPLAGSMGIHFVRPDLAADAVVDAQRPEALMYEQRPNGTLALVGLEYVVFKQAWDAANAHPPELFGHHFHLVAAPNRYGLPAFYALHAWAWKSNPKGFTEDWNPRVLCPNAEGHTT